jgi:hypothetical protein
VFGNVTRACLSSRGSLDLIEPQVSHRVEQRVRSDFERGSIDPVLARLAALDLPLVDSTDGRERIQAAIVLAAHGQWSAFEQLADLAEVDWRDVLVSAGLADEDWQARLVEQLGPDRAV